MNTMNATVLFVDDEELMLSALKRQASKQFNVLTAEGGEQGLKTLAAHSEITVVIADMRMPRMSGIEFLLKVRDLYPNITRMMLTGNLDKETAEEAVKSAKVFNYITKPCETSALLKAVQVCADFSAVQSAMMAMDVVRSSSSSIKS